MQGTPIIYASINYRVGPFGFPQGAEATALGALNLGLKDQLAGLEWIHNNIAAFGGDPSKVSFELLWMPSELRDLSGHSRRRQRGLDVHQQPILELSPSEVCSRRCTSPITDAGGGLLTESL